MFALLGALLPHLGSILGFAGKIVDAKFLVQYQELAVLKYGLQYHGIRVLISVVVSVALTIWAVEMIRELELHWNDPHYNAAKLFGGAGISGAVRSFLRRF